MKKTAALASLLAVFLTACQPGGTSDEPIKIGYIGPLTGDAASYGVDTLNGVKLALEDINAAGGVTGRPLQLTAEDSRCTGADSASAAQKLVHVDKVVAIIGGQCSGETLAAAPIVEAAGIVMISPVSSSPDVTGAGDYVFRDYPSDALKTKAMANYFAEKGYTRVAAISENTDFAIAFRDSLKEHIGADALVLDEVVEPGVRDFRSLMTRLKDLELDVFFPNGQTSAAMGAMMQQFREAGYDQPAVSHDVAQDQSTIEIAGEAADGMLAIGVPEVGDASAFGKKFLAKYESAQAGLAFAGHAYDALGVLAEAIGKVGTDGDAIRDYLYTVKSYKGVVGRFGFDENGDVVGIPYNLYEVIDGKWVPVADIAVN